MKKLTLVFALACIGVAVSLGMSVYTAVTSPAPVIGEPASVPTPAIPPTHQ